MALYLGSGEKLQVNLGSAAYYLNLFSKIPITNGIKLISSDGHILTDSHCLYMTTIIPTYLLSVDDYILKDSDGLYLRIKEDI